MSTLWRADDRFIKTYFTKYPVSFVLNVSFQTTAILIDQHFIFCNLTKKVTLHNALSLPNNVKRFELIWTAEP